MSTAISWTTETWNPIHGCSRVSAGCKKCYAERISLRYGHTDKPWTYTNAEENVTIKPHKLKEPERWKDPRRIFVNSMSDLFHEQVPDAFIRKVFEKMASLPRHTFQILTKRPDRMSEWSGPWTENIWMGVSVEEPRWESRIDKLRQCGAQTTFVSFEPLIERIPNPNLSGIDWAIVGGESDSEYREMPHSWAREIRDACLEQGVAFFFKQSAGYRTELDVALEHEDGTYWIWQQFPNHRRKPFQVESQLDGDALTSLLQQREKDQGQNPSEQSRSRQLSLTLNR